MRRVRIHSTLTARRPISARRAVGADESTLPDEGHESWTLAIVTGVLGLLVAVEVVVGLVVLA
jgi:hypothetical protein